jgi:hypothetical protein
LMNPKTKPKIPQDFPEEPIVNSSNVDANANQNIIIPRCFWVLFFVRTYRLYNVIERYIISFGYNNWVRWVFTTRMKQETGGRWVVAAVRAPDAANVGRTEGRRRFHSYHVNWSSSL